jgi:hypothetical protein
VSLTQLIEHCIIYRELKFESWSFHLYILKIKFLVTKLFNKIKIKIRYTILAGLKKI